EPCVFPAPARWVEPVPAVPLRAVPLILTDFSSEPYSVRMLTTVARTLAPSCDAVLVGEHQDRPDFPPTLLASMLQEAGMRPWMTLACRDRNRIVLEEELSGRCHLGVDAVLCVTGDARAYDVRPDVTQVFDLDGPRLAALAASIGISAAVPETPASPPRHLRAFRLAQKQRAGAAVAVLNHDTVASVTAFMSDAAGAAGSAWPWAGCWRACGPGPVTCSWTSGRASAGPPPMRSAGPAPGRSWSNRSRTRAARRPGSSACPSSRPTRPRCRSRTARS